MDKTQALKRLAAIPGLTVTENTPLSLYTRFGIGGPADLYAEAADGAAFMRAFAELRAAGIPTLVMGGGTNLVVSDSGVRGAVLRYTASGLCADGTTVHAEAGAVLQELVDFTVERGLQGIETLAGVPGSVGGAVYGNAGAYGHSISECVQRVRFFDGSAEREFSAKECQFRYRESVFKSNKEWIVFSIAFAMQPGDAAELRKISGDIVAVRNEKFPVTMKCAGSVFKNFLLAELPAAVAAAIPEKVVREGKVPAAYFLEQAGAKGAAVGDIHVAAYHANLLYNGGQGTAGDLCLLIGDLKQRVRQRFGVELEEEVQYVGFPD